jgi:hypothetical protein
VTLPQEQLTAGSVGGQVQSGDRAASLGDILERVLDKGLVIAGDIQVNLLDIELLTIKLRLVIASLETAKEVGIDWWEHDPWLRGEDRRELDGGQRRELTAQSARPPEEEAEQPEPQKARRGESHA